MFKLPAACLGLVFSLVGASAQADLFSDTQALVDAGEYEQAVSLLQSKSAQGDSAAQALLGQRYELDQGVEKDLQKAFSLYVDSAQERNPLGQYYIGQAYFKGTGTDRNLISAYLWLSLCSEQASPLQEKALELRASVAGELNALQLEKAEILVEQLKTIYLVD